MEFTAQIGEAAYTEFVANHPKSHFLQSYEWGQASRYRGKTPYYTAVTENGRILAAALLLKKRLPFGFSHFYIPRGYVLDYGNTELLAFFTREIDRFTRAHKSLFFMIDPDIKLHNIDSAAKPLAGENSYPLVKTLEKLGFRRRRPTYYFETCQPRYTFRIDLSPELSEIRKNYDKTTDQCRRYLDRYAGEVYEGGAADVAEFVRLNKMTERRRAICCGDDAFYHHFYRIFDEKGLVSLILVRLDFAKTLAVLAQQLAELETGKYFDEDRHKKLLAERAFFEKRAEAADGAVVGACVNVTYGGKSWYLYSSSDMAYKMVCAGHRMVDYQIERAKARGLRFLDLFGTIGNVRKKPGTYDRLRGLHEFKRKFGGEYLEFIGEFYFIQRPFLYRLYRCMAPLRHAVWRFLSNLREGWTCR